MTHCAAANDQPAMHAGSSAGKSGINRLSVCKIWGSLNRGSMGPEGSRAEVIETAECTAGVARSVEACGDSGPL